jgi:xylan 1,4-beta-xylosidase
VKAFLQSVLACGLHYHSAIEFLLVLQGAINVRIEDEEREVGEGGVILVHGDTLHSTFGRGAPNLVLALQIDPQMFERLDPDFRRRRFMFNERASTKPEPPYLRSIREAMAGTLWESRLQRTGWRMLVEANILRLAAILLREVPNVVEARSNVTGLVEDERNLAPRLQRIVEHIYQNAGETLTLSGVAESEGISSEYLSRLFKAGTDQTFKGFVTSVRLRRALDLLLDQRTRILDVALASGFPNVKAFNAAFLREFDLSPSEWRRSLKVGDQACGEHGNMYAPLHQNDAMTYVRPFLPKD